MHLIKKYINPYTDWTEELLCADIGNYTVCNTCIIRFAIFYSSIINPCKYWTEELLFTDIGKYTVNIN